MKFDDETVQYFKVGSPIPGRVLMNGDSESTSGIRVTIELTVYNNGEVTLYSTTKSTDDDDAAQFLLPTDDIPQNTTSVTLKATSEQFTAYQYLQACYSESKHFVTIVSPFNSVPCIGCYSFGIYHNAESGTLIRYMVFELLKKLNLEFTWNQFNTNEYCRDKLGDNLEKSDELQRRVDRQAKLLKRDVADAPEALRDIRQPIDCEDVQYYWSAYVDSSIALNSIGVYAMSDLMLQTRPCEVVIFSCLYRSTYIQM
ncbi:hypothetical protein LSH36_1438g00003 [Paralvinella palmiformis]|uniref:Uncharacterized protein n=1 Tax=Paralvinella palmiformis TaxID=53620 RepID=A0AAD9ITB2_9ANNE|nr:hypothetical protein LSH36_1438g00003 [Paralvinella palmiformis]